jgi:hypothetical protein
MVQTTCQFAGRSADFRNAFSISRILATAWQRLVSCRSDPSQDSHPVRALGSISGFRNRCPLDTRLIALIFSIGAHQRAFEGTCIWRPHRLVLSPLSTKRRSAPCPRQYASIDLQAHCQSARPGRSVPLNVLPMSRTRKHAVNEPLLLSWRATNRRGGSSRSSRCA